MAAGTYPKKLRHGTSRRRLGEIRTFLAKT